MKKLLKPHPFILFIVLGILFYGNTLFNGYTLDDSLVITENKFVKDGFSGIGKIFTTDAFTGFFGTEKNLVQGGRYRPLSMVLFAVEYQFFGANSNVGHGVNLALFLLVVCSVYTFTLALFKHFYIDEISHKIALVTALLFLSHPVHTEAVANIKGRDEILALLFGLLFLQTLIKQLQTFKQIVLSSILLLAALLSKENAILYPLLGVGLYFLLRHKQPNTLRTALQNIIIVGFSSLAIYFGLRYIAIGWSDAIIVTELLNNPFTDATNSQKFATIAYILLRYLGLLFYPFRLTHDYYPYHIALQSPDSFGVIVSVVIHLFLLVFVFRLRKLQVLWAWLLGFYGMHIILVSNLFFSIGTFMNERFLFAPSFAFCALLAGMAVPFFINRKLWQKRLAFSVLLIILVVFGIKTIDRNKVWKDNYTLFTSDVKISKQSAKVNCSAGAELVQHATKTTDIQLKNKHLNKAILHLKKAIEIHPAYTIAWLNLGNAFFYQDAPVDSVLMAYAKVFELSPQHADAYKNMFFMLKKWSNPTEKAKGYQLVLKYFPNDFEANYLYGRLLAQELAQVPKALPYLEKSLSIQPENQSVLMDAGITYALLHQVTNAEKCFLQLIKKHPENPQYLINLGVLYQQNGNPEKSKILFQKAEVLKAKSQ